MEKQSKKCREITNTPKHQNIFIPRATLQVSISLAISLFFPRALSPASLSLSVAPCLLSLSVPQQFSLLSFRLTLQQTIIREDDALVVTRAVVVALLRLLARPVPTEVKEKNFAGRRGRNHVHQSSRNGTRRQQRILFLRIDEHRDVFIWKPKALNQTAVHSFHVVDASAERVVRARIVAPDQHRRLWAHFLSLLFPCSSPVISRG